MAAALKTLVAKLAKTDDDDALVEILAKIEKLGEASTEAVADVIPMLTRRFRPREAACKALEVMIPEIVARTFVDALKDPARKEATAEAISELVEECEGAMVDQPRIPAFVEVMRDTVVPVLLALVETPSRFVHTLGMFGIRDNGAFDTLVACLENRDPAVRGAAASGLAYFGDRAVPHLVELVDEKDKFARDGFASALGKIGTTKSFGALVKFAKPRYRLPMDLLSMIRSDLNRVTRDAKPAARKAADKAVTEVSKYYNEAHAAWKSKPKATKRLATAAKPTKKAKRK